MPTLAQVAQDWLTHARICCEKIPTEWLHSEADYLFAWLEYWSTWLLHSRRVGKRPLNSHSPKGHGMQPLLHCRRCSLSLSWIFFVVVCQFFQILVSLFCFAHRFLWNFGVWVLLFIAVVPDRLNTNLQFAVVHACCFYKHTLGASLPAKLTQNHQNTSTQNIPSTLVARGRIVEVVHFQDLFDSSREHCVT